jgi:hypothetical protein
MNISLVAAKMVAFLPHTRAKGLAPVEADAYRKLGETFTLLRNEEGNAEAI